MTDEEFLEANHYELKHTTVVGYWVDGCCGYLVSGYHDNKEDACRFARQKIEWAHQAGKNFPIWFFVNLKFKGQYRYSAGK